MRWGGESTSGGGNHECKDLDGRCTCPIQENERNPNWNIAFNPGPNLYSF